MFARALPAWLSLRATRSALLQVGDGTGEAAAAQGGAFALLQVTTGRARLQRRRVDNGTGRRGAGVGGVWWRGGGVVVDAGFGACALLCAVAGDNGAGMDAAAQGGALARDCVFGDWLLT